MRTQCYHACAVLRAVAVSVLVALSGCHAGGEYAGSSMVNGDVDKGETNGRMFDFVSDKPDGDDWQIRIRGTSMWASYSKDAKSDKLGGAQNLSEPESVKLWNMVDGLDIPSRKKGKVDDDNGTVTLRLREPTDDGPHDVYTVYISRDTEDEDVIALGQFLRKLVEKHFNEQPNF
jgi:hypothetical protein